jgi:hypothetical protein
VAGQVVDTESSPASCNANAEIRAFLAERVSPQGWSIVVTCSDATFLATRTARRGALDAASSLLDAGRNLADRSGLTSEVLMVLRSFHMASESYLFYKHGDLERAELISVAAMDIDSRLVVDYGLVAMMTHLVQLGHNIMRVAHRAGDHNRVEELAGTLLDYLSDGDRAFPWATAVPIGGSAALSLECREEFQQQIRREQVSFRRSAAPVAIGTFE